MVKINLNLVSVLVVPLAERVHDVEADVWEGSQRCVDQPHEVGHPAHVLACNELSHWSGNVNLLSDWPSELYRPMGERFT